MKWAWGTDIRSLDARGKVVTHLFRWAQMFTFCWHWFSAWNFSTSKLIFIVFLIWTPQIFLQAPYQQAIIFQVHKKLWQGTNFYYRGRKCSHFVDGLPTPRFRFLPIPLLLQTRSGGTPCGRARLLLSACIRIRLLRSSGSGSSRQHHSPLCAPWFWAAATWQTLLQAPPGEGPNGAKKVRVLRISRGVVVFARRVCRGIRLLLLAQNDRQLKFDIS